MIINFYSLEKTFENTIILFADLFKILDINSRYYALLIVGYRNIFFQKHYIGMFYNMKYFPKQSILFRKSFSL